MTLQKPALPILESEIDAVEATLDRIGSDAPPAAPWRQIMTERVTALCQRATDLPPAEAHAIAARLQSLIAALDRAADRVKAEGGTGDSQNAPVRARQAAAAYGAAASRRRRGF